MRMFSKTWAEMKEILDSNNLYFDYDDEPEREQRVVVAPRNSTIGYECYMLLFDSADPRYAGSDCKDFDDNYSARAGEKTTYIKSWKFDNLAAGITANDFRLDNPAGENIDGWIFRANLCIDGHAHGDTLKFQIIDVDNILGGGAGELVAECMSIIVAASKSYYEFCPTAVDFYNPKKRVLTGLYLRLRYNAQNAGVNLIATMNYEY